MFSPAYADRRSMAFKQAGVFALFALFVGSVAVASAAPDRIPVGILDDPQTQRAYPLPDYSYAGYGFGLRQPPVMRGAVVDVVDHGVVPDDEKDDSPAMLKALAAANAVEGPVIVQLPPGRLILSEVIKIERSNLVVRGSGKGAGGTELFFPRPLKMIDRGHSLDELRAYLLKYDKRQIEPDRNIDTLFSEYSWSGGFIWVQRPGTRPAPYLEKDDPAPEKNRLAEGSSGVYGQKTLRVRSAAKLKAGEVVQIRWFSGQGRQNPLIREIYGETDLAIGEHHWSFRKRALVIQTTVIESIDGDTLTLGDPLLHDVSESIPADVASWDHLSEVGIEDLALVFPNAPAFGHHLEQGYNGIYLTSVFNGWVRDVRIENADSGILTYNSANLTLSGIDSEGERGGHYSVHMGNVHNVLVSDLQVRNPVIHSLSMNTQSTRTVFLRAEVFKQPALDQHAGANHQNLFDNVTLRVRARRDERGPWYPVWDGSGAPYWQPGHGRYNTTWNLRVLVTAGALADETVRLVGAEEGPDARIIGVSGNRNFELDYRPKPYSERVNQALTGIPSLYEYQLALRKAAADTASAGNTR